MRKGFCAEKLLLLLLLLSSSSLLLLPLQFFSSSRSGRKSLDRMCFFLFLRPSKQKTPLILNNYRCCLRLGSPKPRYLRYCLLLVAKKHGIYSVFWTAPSKNIGIYTVFGMLQEVIFPCKSHKTCKLQCFGSAFRVYAVEGGGWGKGIQKEQQLPE